MCSLNTPTGLSSFSSSSSLLSYAQQEQLQSQFSGSLLQCSYKYVGYKKKTMPSKGHTSAEVEI